MSHNIKAVFFDIDGTLIDATTDHLIPVTTKQALMDLRAAGIKLFICSGRTYAEMPTCIQDGWEGFSGFDGFISMNGSYCFDSQTVYRKATISAEEVSALYNLVEQGAFDALAIFPDRSFCNHLGKDIQTIGKMVGLTYHEEDFSQVLTNPTYQFCAFIPPEKDEWLASIMTGCIITRWCNYFCDVIPAASGKDKGIDAACERYGFTLDECMAFGDGGNDADMLAHVGLGVAMGNAIEKAKDAARYTTTDVNKDGIPEALRHFGLID